MKETIPEQNGAGNLTFGKNVVKNHAGLDSLPGYVVVVFEKLPKGGELFFKLIKPGERSQWKFNIPFRDPSKKYYSIAVNQSVLSYSFDKEIILDDEIHKFTLKFRLKYRASDPQRVAELREQDPLGQLCHEIAEAIGRSCTQRKWEMVKDRFRELEMIVMNSEKANLRQYAVMLGFEIFSIEMDKRLPPAVLKPLQAREEAEVEKQVFVITQGVKQTKEEISREREHQRRLEDVEHKYSVRETELDNQLKLQDKEEAVHIYDQKRELREKQTVAIGTAITNVGSNITTPQEMVEGADAVRQIRQTVQSDNGASGSPTELPAAAPAGYLNASGGDGLSGLLNQAFAYIDQWNCPFAQQQALRSAILHIVAEVLLDDQADETLLKQYADKLSEIGKSLQATPMQFRFLDKFRNYERLRDFLK